MATLTTKIGLIKPENEAQNWGVSLNSNMDKLDEAITNNENQITQHINSATAHTASNISCAAINGQINVNAAMQNLLNTKASINHSHTGYAANIHSHSDYANTNHTHTDLASKSHTHTANQILSGIFKSTNTLADDLNHIKTKLENIKDFLNLVNPDSTTISLSTSMQSLASGVRINGDITPDVIPRRFNVTLRDASSNDVIYSGGIANSLSLYIPGNFSYGQNLKVQAQIVLGANRVIYSPTVTYIYNYQPNNVVIGIDINPESDDPIISEYDIRKHLGWCDDESIRINPNIFVQVIQDGQSISYSRQINLSETNNIKHLNSLQLLGLKQGQKYKVVLQVNKSRIK